MNEQSSKPGAANRLPTWVGISSALLFVVLITLLIAFFGALLAAVFELFRLGEFLLRRDWHWDRDGLVYGCCVLVVGVALIHLSWRLALVILGLVTQKYDAPLLSLSTLALPRAEYPAIYDKVAEICELMEIGEPNEIRVTPDASCYVIEERRFAVSTDRWRSVVLGLPQLLVLSVSELEVILVHELSHFRGGDTTLTVFVFRFLESLRVALDDWRASWWHVCDPLYWFFAGFYYLVLLAAVPLQRRQELQADSVSAATLGGPLATHTLLKEWLVENQFAEALEQYLGESQSTVLNGESNVFRLFEDRWRDYSEAGEDYLRERLEQDEKPQLWDTHPPMRTRIRLMQGFPPGQTNSQRQARELVPDVEALQQRVQRQLLLGI